MADRQGISYMRTLRGKTEVRTPADETVQIGGSRIAYDGGTDVAIVACGITVDEAVQAAEALEGDGVGARVIDCYSIKPIDEETLQAAARECGGIVTVEDHWPEGGLGRRGARCAGADARAPRRSSSWPSATCRPPASPTSCCKAAGIDAEAIAAAAREVAGARSAA